MIISVLAFSIVADYGIEFLVDTISDFTEKNDEKNNIDNESTDNSGLITQDFSVTGTYSFVVFVTKNNYVPDYVPSFDGYTYDSILETYEMQYSQTLRYVIVVTIDAANHQVLVDTMSGNFLVSYNGVNIPLDHVYYMVRNGVDGLGYRYLADIAGTYTGLYIDNYFITPMDRFCDIANYTPNTEISIPERFIGTTPFTNEVVNVAPGNQPLTFDLLYMMLDNDSFLTYEGVCRSTSDVFTAYMKSILKKDNINNIGTLIKRWKQKSTTDISQSAISEKTDLIFSVGDYNTYNVFPSATMKKYGDNFYYVININESITNIKKYYNKASS